MKTPENAPPAPRPQPEQLYACTVLVAGTRIGSVKKGKEAKVNLTLRQAEALARLNPPRVRIDGI